MLTNQKKNIISVVIPMYNSSKTIAKTLESIKNQTAFDMILEVLVVNDGSTDNSANIVDEYKKNNIDFPIQLINKVNGGVSSARNTGMKAARGEWIALLDSDDIWLPNKIELQMKNIEMQPDIDFLGGDIDERGLRILWKKINHLYKADVKDICIKNFPQTSTAIFKKKIYDQIGGFDEKQRYAEDGNYFLKICNKYNFYHLPEQLVYYGDGKPGFGHSGLSANLKGMYQGNLKNINELRDAKIISACFYYFIRLFFWLKYIRRLILTIVNTRR